MLRDDVISIENLKISMLVNGVVRNVYDFGVFVDTGIKHDAFLHFNMEWKIMILILIIITNIILVRF